MRTLASLSLRTGILCLLLVLFLVVGTATAWAQGRSITLIRDAEIEDIIRTYSTPLFQAAGLNPQAVTVYLVKDNSLNAFVAGGQNMFIHTGLLQATDDPLEVIGVIAHETGHISGGHLATLGGALEQAQRNVLATYALGLGAALATGNPAVGVAVITGGQDVALKGLLRYTRTQESAADQAAVNLLRSTGQSPSGLLTFMNKLSGQEVLFTSNQDPYLRTHPLTDDRVSFIEQAVEESPYADQPASPELLDLHARMQAKLTGFLQTPTQVLRAYPESDNSLPARYARAISYYRQPDLDRALPLIDGLIEEEPDNPYFYELKGQMLFENGRIAEALEPYQRAADLAPEAPSILLRLAQVQVALDDPQMDDAALDNLQLVFQDEPRNALGWRLASTAYGRRGDKGMTTLALAEYALATGKFKEAIGRAKRAEDLLPTGSPGWLRSQDVLGEAERLEKRARDR